MPISFRRITRDSESSIPRPPFVSRPSGGNLLGTRPSRPSGGTGGGKQNFQKAKGSFLPNNQSRPAVRIGKAGSGIVNRNAMRSHGGLSVGGKNTDFLTRQLNRPADASLKNLPELTSGWMRSIDLSNKFEKGLYQGFLNAGGKTSSFLAKGNNNHVSMFVRSNRLKNRDFLVKMQSNAEDSTNEALEAAYQSGDVEKYKEAIEKSFGFNILTIDDPSVKTVVPELTIEALREYQLGAQMLASFLENVYFDDASKIDKYAFFKDVMGNLTIKRTDVRPPESGDTAPGYTGNPTIYDMFSYYQGDEDKKLDLHTRTYDMSALNFLHELGHSLNDYSRRSLGGFFNTLNSVQFAQIETSLKQAAMGDLALQHEVDVGDGVQIGEDSEILADMIMFAANGVIPNGVKRDQFRSAIKNAMAFNSPDLYTKNFSTSDPITLTEEKGTSLRTQPNGIRIKSFDKGYSVQPLGRSEDGWIYVTTNYGGGAIYGWMSADLLNNLSNSVKDSLPVIDQDLVSQTSFDPNSPYNPKP